MPWHQYEDQAGTSELPSEVANDLISCFCKGIARLIFPFWRSPVRVFLINIQIHRERTVLITYLLLKILFFLVFLQYIPDSYLIPGSVLMMYY